MLSSFSVRKPFTVLVAVVLIIVLGVVSFSNMTPDLLPEIDLPYIMVMTTYTGATPEEVETAISQPMEELLNTLDNVESISSTSSEGYSLVTLAFSEKSDLENAALSVREKISPLTSSWDEEIGTPTILKISPDMLPINVSAVSYMGMDTVDLSRFVKDTLMPALEGTDGIASVSASGLVSERVDVEIDPEKIASINRQIVSAILEKTHAQKNKLDVQHNELQKQIQALNDALTEIDDGKTVLEEQRQTAATQYVQAQIQLNKEKTVLQNTQIQLTNQITDTKNKISKLDDNIAALKPLLDELNKVNATLNEAKTTVATLSPYIPTVNKLNTMLAQRDNYENALVSIGYSKEDARNYLMRESADYGKLLDAIVQFEATVASSGYTASQLPEVLRKAQDTQLSCEASLSALDATLSSQELSSATLPGAISKLQASRDELAAAQAAMEDGVSEVVNNQNALDDSLENLFLQKNATEQEIDAALGDLLASEEQVQQDRTLLEAAMDELDKAYEQLNAAEQLALKNADISNKITFTALAQLFRAQNFSLPAGYAKDKIVGVDGELENIEELSNLLLFSVDEVGDIRLSDVTSISLLDNSDEIFARVNQADGILLSFSKQSDAATVDACRNLEKQMHLLEKQHDGLYFYSLMDQGDYIHTVIRSVLENLIVGAILAIVILFLFLHDIRPTFMVAVSIPLSVLLAIVLMYFSGVTLNVLSLSGFAVGVGMLVDNSIVTIENIYRLRSRGVAPAKAAVTGTQQILGAITSSTLTTICVFLPFVFIQGLTRKLFTDMALTITFALLASLLIAMTLIPCVAAGTLKRIAPPSRGHLFLMNSYEFLLTRALRVRWPILILAFLLLIGSGFLAFAKGFEYMPDMESTEIMVSLKMPDDSSIDYTSTIAEEAIARIQEIDGVRLVGAMTGSGVGSALGISNGQTDTTNVSMYVLLEDDAPRSMRRIVEEIELRTETLPCTVSASASNSVSGYSSALSGNGISISLYAQDLTLLAEEARNIASILQDVEGIDTVSDGLEKTAPALNISIDHDAAARLGLTTVQIYSEISTALSKSIAVATLKEPPVDICIVNPLDLTPESLKTYELVVNTNATDTENVCLGDIAEITEGTTFASIHRSEQRRTVTVQASIAKDYNITQVASTVQDTLNQQYTIPSGLTLEFSGESESIYEALNDLVKVLALGILMVYLIMVAQFQSLLSPFIVMFAVPLAFTGGLLALVICGFEISIISTIGFVILVGIVVNNGIVLVDSINHLRSAGVVRREAIIEAGRMRLRPILMTALTTILGLVPMSLNLGVGSSLIQPIAVVGIGGLTYSTLMTLFIIPILYDLFHKNSPDRIIFKKLDLSSDSDDSDSSDSDAPSHKPKTHKGLKRPKVTPVGGRRMEALKNKLSNIFHKTPAKS